MFIRQCLRIQSLRLVFRNGPNKDDGLAFTQASEINFLVGYDDNINGPILLIYIPSKNNEFSKTI
jgi:hypothetical protein